MSAEDTEFITPHGGDDAGHLARVEVAAYVDGRLSGDRRRAVEEHIADCDSCREEIVGVSRSVKEMRRRRRSTWWLPTATAAGIAGLVALGVAIRGGPSSEDVVLRDPVGLQEEGVPRIEVIAPAEGSVMPRTSLRFVWRAVGTDAFYRFTLTDDAGDVLWRGSTRDTTLALVDEVALEPGPDYFWYVDTLLEGGSTATTDIRRFTVGAVSP